MDSKSQQVLLVNWPDGEAASLAALLAQRKLETVIAPSLNTAHQFLVNHDKTLVIIDYDRTDDEGVEFLQTLAHEHTNQNILVLSEEQDKQRLIALLEAGVLTNLLARNATIESHELLVTVGKIFGDSLFGMARYFTQDVAIEEMLLNDSRQKAGALEKIDALGASLGLNRRLISLAKGVADELLMNAIYNAPMTAAGAPRYARRARTQPVELEAEETVTFQMACDGRQLAISVTDNFGSLEVSTIQRYLARCFNREGEQIEMKAGGAGMGLFYIFSGLSHFIINIDAGKRTEMIGLMDVSKNYRQFAERPKSFNIFVA